MRVVVQRRVLIFLYFFIDLFWGVMRGGGLVVAEMSVELMRECVRACGSAEGSVEMMYRECAFMW